MVVLISYAAYATDECAGGTKGPIQCFECDSKYPDQWYCDDPFNSSHPDLRTEKCDGSCTKWVKKPRSGPMTVKRTCSESLKLNMPISHVCMLESRPGDGHLCFCGKDECNHGNSLHNIHSPLTAILLSLLTFLLVSRHLVHAQPMRLWPSSGIDCTTRAHTNVDAHGEYVGYLQRHRQNDIKDINTG